MNVKMDTPQRKETPGNKSFVYLENGLQPQNAVSEQCGQYRAKVKRIDSVVP